LKSSEFNSQNLRTCDEREYDDITFKMKIIDDVVAAGTHKSLNARQQLSQAALLKVRHMSHGK
jgi:hypothetical protein